MARSFSIRKESKPTRIDHGREIGQIYRVGYYAKQDGTDTVWLVDSSGDIGGLLITHSSHDTLKSSSFLMRSRRMA